MKYIKISFKKRTGSTFLVVIGILAIIFFAATLFMSSTIQEGKQTHMTIRGLHAASLAEAALERATRLIIEKANKVDREDTANFTENNFGFKLRLPATEGSSNYGLSENFGTDKELNLNEEAKKEVVFKKDDLQPDGQKELDELVKYMTGVENPKYEVTVKAKITNAFRNSPGKDYLDFKVPGVDIPWNTRYDVKNFLEGNGYTAFEISIPEDWTWLNISIPVEVMGIKICDINVTKVLDFIDIGGKKISDFTSINFIASYLFNDLLHVNYPFEIKFDKLKDKMQNNTADLWPISVTVADGQYLEKYGQLTLECEAKIEYPDNYTSARRITAVKEFKVSDCEPPAPMYSLFINNLPNNYIDFNNYGGQFVVNNFDYTRTLGKIKEVFTGTSNLSDEEVEGREYPGLIRVNYVDNSADKTNPLICNVGCVGDLGATQIDDDSNGFVRFFQGAEVALICCPKSEMGIVGTKYNINAKVEKKEPESKTDVPSNMKTSSSTSSSSSSGSSSSGMGDKVSNLSVHMDKSLVKEFWKNELGINLVPSIGDMSCNVFELAVTLALKPLVELGKDALAGDKFTSFLSVPDCFESWEMPNMGTDWQYYTLPTTGTSVNKSHLFGYAGLHPTMTKEIEGNVMKAYKQWSMVIVGMKTIDRLPLLPFPPYKLPPIPIPIWKAATVLNKYAFNAGTLLPNGDDGQTDLTCHEYDPNLLENMAPNLYTNEQYAKKATYYYENPQAFIDDLPNRITKIGENNVFVLNGITYISGSLGEENTPFTVDGGKLYVAGKGMIVVSGNMYLGCDIIALDRSADEHTVFSLMCRKGGLIITGSDKKLRFEGSLYTDYGIFLNQKSSLHIIGNWVTNEFNKMAMGGTVVIDYCSSRVRSSLKSLHPTQGKYDPRRYHVSFSPTWSSWRAH